MDFVLAEAVPILERTPRVARDADFLIRHPLAFVVPPQPDWPRHCAAPSVVAVPAAPRSRRGALSSRRDPSP